MPNSRFALHGKRPSLITNSRFVHLFASNSRFMRLLQAALDTCFDSPFSATLSVHGLHFTVCAPSRESGGKPLKLLKIDQHQAKGNNNNNSKTRLMQQLGCASAVALLSPTVEKVL